PAVDAAGDRERTNRGVAFERDARAVRVLVIENDDAPLRAGRADGAAAAKRIPVVGGILAHLGRSTVSTSAGWPAFTLRMARASAPSMPLGSVIGPSPYQPQPRAIVAKSGSGPAMSWPIWARSTAVSRWCATWIWCSQSL